MMKQSIAASITPVQAVQSVQSVQAAPILSALSTAQEANAFMNQFNFDLNNHYHSSMRRLMVDVHTRHGDALADANPISAARYRGMAQGLERVALQVLNDSVLYHACSELVDELERLHEDMMAEPEH